MSTTIVGQKPAPYRPFRGLVQVGYSSSRATSPSSTETNANGEETLLAISLNRCINGVSQSKPFYLPSEGLRNSVEKSLGYGAFGVVW